MIRDSLLVFREPERLMPILPAILAGAGVRVEPGTVRWADGRISADVAPSVSSWWGERVSIALHRDDGGTTAVEFVSVHKGPSAFKDLDNVAKLRRSFQRTMKSLGVTMAWVRPRLE